VGNADREAILGADGVSKSFELSGAPLPVLDDISFDIPVGSWTTLLGPSGCGKTTLLRILAGLTPSDSGSVRLGTPATPPDRACAYLPQADTLLPWRSAIDNAILPQELAGVRGRDARSEAQGLFRRFGLSGFEDQYPRGLSGGMRQRVAIIRTFLAHREVLLLDEPLGSLDPLTRMDLQDWLTGVWEELGKTMVLVTHDVEEALLLSDCVHLLSARPATICQSIDLDWVRPRDRSGAELAAKRSEILEVLVRGGTP